MKTNIISCDNAEKKYIQVLVWCDSHIDPCRCNFIFHNKYRLCKRGSQKSRACSKKNVNLTCHLFHQTLPYFGLILYLERVKFWSIDVSTHWTLPQLGRVTRDTVEWILVFREIGCRNGLSLSTLVKNLEKICITLNKNHSKSDRLLKMSLPDSLVLFLIMFLKI